MSGAPSQATGRMGDPSCLTDDEREALAIGGAIGRLNYAYGGARPGYADEDLDKIERAAANLQRMAQDARERRR